MQRNNQRKQRPQLLKNRMAEVARMTPAKTDEVHIKGEHHGFTPLDHFAPDQVEQRIQTYLNSRRM